MELSILDGILLLITIVMIIFTVYNRNSYKNKNNENLSLEEQIIKNKNNLESSEQKINENNKILENTNIYINQKSDELKILNSDINCKKEELQIKRDELKELFALEKKSKNLEANVIKFKDEIITLENRIQDKVLQQKELEQELKKIKGDISLYSPTAHLLDIGFYQEPKYLYETAERYKIEIQIIRDKQKALIINNKAVDAPMSIAIIEDDVLARKAIQGQIKIMLKSFNIETDLLLLGLKPSTFAKTMERIEKIATDIEKSALSFKCGFNEEYIKLKLQECQLQYQFKLKQAEEDEEQKAIKEQMREEQKAIREFEQAIAKAQKEEQMYQDALGQAKKELEIANNEEKDKLTLKIELLEAKLKEAMDKEGRAKSMAEQTRRGHVYVISNIGSFGEHVYKIGMTRRLEPLDRVKELGDASVPFLFDVHAMIFSEDAPKLEKQLHKVFINKRVNMVNERKEFFNVTLDEIKKEVEKTDNTIEFTMLAQAEEYRESLSIKKSLQVSI